MEGDEGDEYFTLIDVFKFFQFNVPITSMILSTNRFFLLLREKLSFNNKLNKFLVEWL